MAKIGYGQTRNDIVEKVQVLVNKLNITIPWPEGRPTDKCIKATWNVIPTYITEWFQHYAKNEQAFPLTIYMNGSWTCVTSLLELVFQTYSKIQREFITVTKRVSH